MEVGSFPFVMSIQLNRSPDDMFGADDADWAIYRKIVSGSRPVVVDRCRPNRLYLEHRRAVFRRGGGAPTITGDRAEIVNSRPHVHY
jgi:hypothetical protein